MAMTKGLISEPLSVILFILIGPFIHVYDEDLIVTQMSGMLTISDLTTGTVGLGGAQCNFTLDATCTGGIAGISTTGEIVDNSTGTTVVLGRELNNESIAEATWEYERI